MARSTRVRVDSLNLCGAAWERLQGMLAAHYPDLPPLYQALRRERQPYHQALRAWQSPPGTDQRWMNDRPRPADSSSAALSATRAFLSL